MAKNTGMIRKVDELGRIVIPMEIRKKFNIEEKDELEVFVEGNTIILKKYEPYCTFCGEKKAKHTLYDKLICDKCLEEIKNNY